MALLSFGDWGEAELPPVRARHDAGNVELNHAVGMPATDRRPPQNTLIMSILCNAPQSGVAMPHI
jgi:hypothetical protein